jgi:predicted TIM-barrel fold metal-dependent hydrolase
VREFGFLGVFLHPSPDNGRQWHELQEMNVPVSFHEGTGTVIRQPGDQFGKNRIMLHVASHPIAMMYISLSLIIGGVLEAFPRLRVALLECNTGWVPFWLDRIDHDFAHSIGFSGRQRSLDCQRRLPRYFPCAPSSQLRNLSENNLNNIGNLKIYH